MCFSFVLRLTSVLCAPLPPAHKDISFKIAFLTFLTRPSKLSSFGVKTILDSLKSPLSMDSFTAFWLSPSVAEKNKPLSSFEFLKSRFSNLQAVKFCQNVQDIKKQAFQSLKIQAPRTLPIFAIWVSMKARPITAHNLQPFGSVKGNFFFPYPLSTFSVDFDHSKKF